MAALLIEDVERDRRPRADGEVMGDALEKLVLQRAQHMQGHALGGADDAGAEAVRADFGGAFEHAGADALAAHLHQAEMRDPADLDARAVVLEAILELALHRLVVAALFHVDEIDHDEARKVAQAQLARDLLGGFHVGLVGRVLDVVLAGRPAGVHVDRDQRLGLVDDDVAARAQGHLRREHRVELRLHRVAREDRRGVAVGLDVLGMARHEHAHEVLGLAVGLVTGHEDLGDVLVVEVADRALDQRALLVDQRRRAGLEGQVAHVLPQAQQILEVALDLGLGAARTGGAQDDAHALGHFQLVSDLLEALAVGDIGDLAGDAAAAPGVRHQHRIAAGKRQIGGERRTLVAALFLDDLHQQDLPALDHFLDLVLARPRLAAHRHLFHGVFGAHRLDVILVVAVMVVAAAAADFRHVAAMLARRSVLGLVLGAVVRRGRVVLPVVAVAVAVVAAGVLGHRLLVAARRAGLAAGAVAIAGRGAVVAPALPGRARVEIFVRLGLFGIEQRLTVGPGDLVVVGMDFREGEEAVAVAAVFHEGRLKRRLHARHLGKVDVATQLFAVGGLEVKLLDARPLDHHNPGLLRVGGIDKHLVGHQ
ncbi:hypothetical protein A6302_02893 [Methylobrevis pamukkalensis]|uniref:NAD-specific glutamate dehydrogenase n=1 Tax=Methylobrevis pamukkalensis TaxID=1439726 RepID=A0A1E3H2K6_9HYPH|nr:hypothetical protein A6302_02893 [Methylobrevis pamukkalensis]